MSDKPHIIFVIGVHRSGTSAVTRALNFLGADIGEELLGAQEGVNDRGFWELESAVRLNEKVLASLESRWFDFRELEKAAFARKSMQGFVEQAKEILKQNFSDKPLAVVKDPRFCRLFPLWKQAIEELGWEKSVVNVTRNPLEVVDSLNRRDGFSRGMCGLIWTTYTVEMLQLTKGENRISLDYDFFLRHLHQAMNKLVAHIPLLNKPEPILEAARKEISSELRHHSRGLNSSDESEIFSVMWELHELSNEVNSADMPEGADYLFKSYADYLKRSSGVNDELFETATLLVEARKEAVQIGHEHTHAQEVVQKRDEQLANHQTREDSLQEDVDQLNLTITEKSRQVETIREQFLELLNKDKSEMEGSQLMLAKELVTESQRQVKSVERALLSKEEQMNSWVSRYQITKLEADEFKQDLNAIQVKYEKLENTFSNLSDERGVFLSENARLIAENNALIAKARMFEDEIKRFQFLVSEQEKNSGVMSIVLQDKSEMIKAVESSLVEKQKELDGLHIDLSRTQSALDAALSRADNLDGELTSEKEILAMMSQKLESQGQQLTELQERFLVKVFYK